MTNSCAVLARRTALALLLLSPVYACGQSGTSSQGDEAGQERPAPGVFDTTLDYAAYGNATAKAEGNALRIEMTGDGESGIALTLKSSVAKDTVATFSLDVSAPMNLRVTRPDGTVEYLSTENRGHVVLGPSAASEALIYGAGAGQLTLTTHSAETCGGGLLCAPDGAVTVRTGQPGEPRTLIATPYGAAGLSHPSSDVISATRGGPAGEYGFTLTPETESNEALLVEFETDAARPINLLVQDGDNKDYISSNQGWIRLMPGSTVLAYTPGAGMFSLRNIRVSACSPEDARCGANVPEAGSEPAP